MVNLAHGSRQLLVMTLLDGNVVVVTCIAGRPGRGCDARCAKYRQPASSQEVAPGKLFHRNPMSSKNLFRYD